MPAPQLVAAETERARAGALSRNTARRPCALGVFGAPTFVVDGEIYWGQDRLEFVDRALAKKRAGQAS